MFDSPQVMSAAKASSIPPTLGACGDELPRRSARDSRQYLNFIGQSRTVTIRACELFSSELVTVCHPIAAVRFGPLHVLLRNQWIFRVEWCPDESNPHY